MAEVDWDERARQGTGLQSVIDPGDRHGLKNGLIDRIQWNCVGPWAATRRHVLDFGCGIGRFAGRITALGASYTGTDASAAMIEAAQRLHPGTRARFLQSGGPPLPLADASVDGCLTVGVLQCLVDDEGATLRAALSDIARVLAPGGELLMIEQASASGRHSGSVSHSISEQDYLDALAPHFDVAGLQRLRLGGLSRFSGAYIRHGRWLPGRPAVEITLARHETRRAREADEAVLRAQTYHDVAIRAIRRG